ncbi:MAG TPA: cytochrome C oxidase subunit IV family protein [Ignavibacteriaceae bacterium]|nr:cytochrome C oxidase subunit IV family protein [Ignavibacteriaceae bacterium]
MDNHSHSNNNHTPHYGIYIIVWLALLILTGVTVAVAGINFGGLTIATALLIASIKSYLVLTIFMHLKNESKVFSLFVGVALLFLLVSFVLLFADYSFL